MSKSSDIVEKTESGADIQDVRRVTKDDVIHLMSVRYETHVQESIKAKKKELDLIERDLRNAVQEVEERLRHGVLDDARTQAAVQAVKNFLRLNPNVKDIQASLKVKILIRLRRRDKFEDVPAWSRTRWGSDLFEKTERRGVIAPGSERIGVQIEVLVRAKAKLSNGTEHEVKVSTGDWTVKAKRSEAKKVESLMARYREVDREVVELEDEVVGIPKRKRLLRAELTERALKSTPEGESFLETLRGVAAAKLDPQALLAAAVQ